MQFADEEERVDGTGAMQVQRVDRVDRVDGRLDRAQFGRGREVVKQEKAH